jgi:hypothetical protein
VAGSFPPLRCGIPLLYEYQEFAAAIQGVQGVLPTTSSGMQLEADKLSRFRKVMPFLE